MGNSRKVPTGSDFKTWRLQKNMTQLDIHNKTGISLSQIKRIEKNGDKELSKQMRRKFFDLKERCRVKRDPLIKKLETIKSRSSEDKEIAAEIKESMIELLKTDMIKAEVSSKYLKFLSAALKMLCQLKKELHSRQNLIPCYNDGGLKDRQVKGKFVDFLRDFLKKSIIPYFDYLCIDC